MNDYTVKCLKEAYFEQNKTGLPFGDECESEVFHEGDIHSPDIKVIINGHRYNLS